MKKRADLLLLECGLARSRTQARVLIEAGAVFQIEEGQRRQIKSGSESLENPKLVVEESTVSRYISRGGLKLEGAFQFLQISLEGLRIFDVGQSTGGFTDCCLQFGAREVVGIDVGKDQLARVIKDDNRVRSMEGVNARDLKQIHGLGIFDLIVVDVSFISLTLVLTEISQYASRILALVKPQFEVGLNGLGKGGIVKDLSQFLKVENKIIQHAQKIDWKVVNYFPSVIDGKDGNSEFFVYLEK